MHETAAAREPTLVVALVPIVFLIGLMVANVWMFGDDATYGPNQLALVMTAVIAGAIGLVHLGVTYAKLEEAIVHSISLAMRATLILFTVGSLIAVWMLSGIVPAIVYYGVQILDPAWFLVVACLISAIVSLSTGSSWSTSGTIGVALIAIGQTLGVPIPMVAGAVISGAYFGDKMSPMSDTTNLAPAMAGTDLFTHIRHMVYSSGPAIVLALIGFVLLGWFYQGHGVGGEQIAEVRGVIATHFNLNPLLFVVPVAVIAVVARGMPALPALVLGVLAGAVAALVFQPGLVAAMAGDAAGATGVYKVLISTAADGFKIETGNAMIDELFSRGGMSSMLNTVWLIICAMVFGGMMEATGVLRCLAHAVLHGVASAARLIGSTIGACLLVNITASDQYISIVVPARMFRPGFDELGLHPKNLSRAVEDAGTVTSVLVPWNTCGAFHAGVLGVPTLAYLPYCFFNILSPIVSMFLAVTGLTIERVRHAHEEGLIPTTTVARV